MRQKMLPLILAVPLLAACVSLEERVSDTKWPQALINADKEEIRNEIRTQMVLEDARVEVVSDALIQLRFPDPKARLMKLLHGCGSCQPPYLLTNLSLSAEEGKTRVIARYWRAVPQLHHSVKRLDLDNADDYNRWQKRLWKLRDKYAGRQRAPVAAIQETMDKEQAKEPARPQKTGQHEIQASRLSVRYRCSENVTLLEEKNGRDTYSAECASGDSLVISCEWGRCRLLQ